MKGSAIIISFFVIGCIVGIGGVTTFDPSQGSLSTYILYLLMFCVGMSLGADRPILSRIRGLNPRMILLPLMTIIGTLAGCLCVSPLIDISPLDSMAVGAGMGYYSLSSIFIGELRGLELGAIALISNITREIFTLLLAPWVAKRFGPLSAISIGGATTFDTTLPIITRATGEQYAIVSIYHGCVTDFSVPFMLTLLCSI